LIYFKITPDFPLLISHYSFTQNRFFDFVYVLVNTLREKPDFEFRKSFAKIKKIKDTPDKKL